MATPEGKVKDLLKKELAKLNVVGFTDAVSIMKADKEALNGYYFMPQATGQGEAGVADFVMCILGQYVEVEVKAKGGTHSDIQKLHSDVIDYALGDYYLVEGEDEVYQFSDYLMHMINNLQKAYKAADKIKDEIDKLRPRRSFSKGKLH